MKLFLVLVLVGYASATLFEALERESRATVNAFINGIQEGIPLHEALGIEDTEEVQRLERGIREELTKHIKDAFEKALKKIEDAVADGKQVNKEALKNLRDLRDKMMELNIEDEEVKEELEVLKERVDSHLRQILEKMGIVDKRSADIEAFESVLGDLSLREMFIKLKNMVLEKMDVGSMKNSLAKVVGQGAQKLCEWLTNKGKEKVLDFFDRILGSDEETKKRAAEDRFEAVKDYLENVEEDAENKLARFREWLDDLLNRGIDKAKDGIQILRKLLQEINLERKNISKKGLAEILEYLNKWEDKILSFHDIKEKIKELLSKED